MRHYAHPYPNGQPYTQLAQIDQNFKSTKMHH